MTKTRISIFLMTLFILSAYGSLSYAQDVVLCLNSADQYVVVVGQDGDCLEEESQVKISGSETAELEGLTPVALFENNDKCDTEGSISKLGFDKNGNYELDEDEIMNTSSTCARKQKEESDE